MRVLGVLDRGPSTPKAFPRRARSRSATRARCSPSNRNLKDVYAIGDQGGKLTVTKVLKGLNSPNA